MKNELRLSLIPMRKKTTIKGAYRNLTAENSLHQLPDGTVLPIYPRKLYSLMFAAHRLFPWNAPMQSWPGGTGTEGETLGS